jgi:hypothetical protein
MFLLEERIEDRWTQTPRGKKDERERSGGLERRRSRMCSVTGRKE